eukprot:TRINITY_DN12984_c0_g1_i1.p1 TRINITY_DN12984_c0_g1~~TRINITY_DN12984_c0_g1_i1.p1  ORF type:complete len:284 (-),score=56.49 TRINITY_DN12984_c0_g1_i1:210-1061(-)
MAPASTISAALAAVVLAVWPTCADRPALAQLDVAMLCDRFQDMHGHSACKQCVQKAMLKVDADPVGLVRECKLSEAMERTFGDLMADDKVHTSVAEAAATVAARTEGNRTAHKAQAESMLQEAEGLEATTRMDPELAKELNGILKAAKAVLNRRPRIPRPPHHTGYQLRRPRPAGGKIAVPEKQVASKRRPRASWTRSSGSIMQESNATSPAAAGGAEARANKSAPPRAPENETRAKVEPHRSEAEEMEELKQVREKVAEKRRHERQARSHADIDADGKVHGH